MRGVYIAISLLFLLLSACSSNESSEKVEGKEVVEKEKDALDQTAKPYLGESELTRTLIEKGYSVEELEEYKGIEVNGLTNDLDIVANDFCSSKPCFYKVYSNAIFEHDTSFVNAIIIVKNKDGEIVNPDKDSVIKEEATNLSKLNEEANIQTTESNTIQIGMTKEEVLAIWGKPQDINRTITAYGTSEQWVYPNYQYLYFEDGILTTIQD